MNPLTDLPQIMFGLAWSNNSKMVGLTLIDKFQAKMGTQVGLLIVFKNDRKNDRFSFRSNFFLKTIVGSLENEPLVLNLLKTNNDVFFNENCRFFKNKCFF